MWRYKHHPNGICTEFIRLFHAPSEELLTHLLIYRLEEELRIRNEIGPNGTFGVLERFEVSSTPDLHLCLTAR